MLICAGALGVITLGAVIAALELDWENGRYEHFEGHWKTTEREDEREAVEETVRRIEEFILTISLRCCPQNGRGRRVDIEIGESKSGN